jgi:hypothetical protein
LVDESNTMQYLFNTAAAAAAPAPNRNTFSSSNMNTLIAHQKVAQGCTGERSTLPLKAVIAPFCSRNRRDPARSPGLAVAPLSFLE